MILVDTSIWIEHFRRGVGDLVSLLEQTKVCCHPFIVGELACGNLRNRREILQLLSDLPTVLIAKDTEVLVFIEQRRLMGRGIGYIDAHLLASVFLNSSSRIWTGDKRFGSVAKELGVAM